MAEGKTELIADDINKEIIGKLKMTGLVNEDTDIIRMLDKGITTGSDIIPVGLKKDGTLTAASQTASMAEYNAISRFVNKKIKEFGRNILNGDISVNPAEMGSSGSCTYCSYRSICGYDEKISGFSKRKLDISADEAMAKIINEGGDNGS